MTLTFYCFLQQEENSGSALVWGTRIRLSLLVAGAQKTRDFQHDTFVTPSGFGALTRILINSASCDHRPNSIKVCGITLRLQTERGLRLDRPSTGTDHRLQVTAPGHGSTGHRPDPGFAQSGLSLPSLSTCGDLQPTHPRGDPSGIGTEGSGGVPESQGHKGEPTESSSTLK